MWCPSTSANSTRGTPKGSAAASGPFPDVVVFRSEMAGDWRRRNRDNTLRRMLTAVEVKVSERGNKRFGPKEIVDDVPKPEALRIEALLRGGSDMLPAVATQKPTLLRSVGVFRVARVS